MENQDISVAVLSETSGNIVVIGLLCMQCKTGLGFDPLISLFDLLNCVKCMEGLAT